MMIAVDLVIVVGDAVQLVGPQVMRIGGPQHEALTQSGIGLPSAQQSTAEAGAASVRVPPKAASARRITSVPAGRAGIPMPTASAKNR